MTCERVSDWPQTMLAADPKTSRGRLGADVRPVCSITSRSVMALGSWNVGRRCMILTWGFITSMPRRRITRGACRPRAATALILLPHPGNASPLLGGFPGTTSADDELSHSVIMSA